MSKKRKAVSDEETTDPTPQKRSKTTAYEKEKEATTKYISTAGLDYYIAAAKNLLPTNEKLCFVDIGCGDGRLLHRAATRHKLTAIGIEIKSEIVQNCKSDLYEIIDGDATKEEFANLYKKGNIIFVNNYVFTQKTNGKIANMMRKYCRGNAIIIASADIEEELNPNKLKKSWRRIRKDTSEGIDALTSPCEWNSKLTVYFYQKRGLIENVEELLQKQEKNLLPQTLEKYISIFNKLEYMYKANEKYPNNINEMKETFPNTKQDVLRLILAEFKKEFEINQPATRNRAK
jgi:SAM-dependent methyltransferase